MIADKEPGPTSWLVVVKIEFCIIQQEINSVVNKISAGEQLKVQNLENKIQRTW